MAELEPEIAQIKAQLQTLDEKGVPDQAEATELRELLAKYENLLTNIEQVAQINTYRSL